jgi:hypothetical protein
MRCIYFLFLALALRAGAQAPPSNEEFLNEVFGQMEDSSVTRYYLITGTDTCRFEKFDYDEWIKYHLQETVPITVLNELAYKVYVEKEPYYWRQDKLPNAVCITAKTADSLLALPAGSRVYSLSRPYFTDDGQYAVMDMNVQYRPVIVYGFTLLYHRTPKGWRQIGMKQNLGPID